MTGRRGGRRIGRLAAAATATAGLLGAAAGLAQVDPPGGIDLGFSVNQQVIGTDNADLEPDPEGTTIRADTTLSFRLSSETRLDTLFLTGATIYRYADGPDISENGFTDPSFNLGYRRQGANSAASANLSYSSAQIAFIRPLTDFVDDDGVFTPPEDLDDLNGTGRRTDIRGSASLAFGLQGPFGATLTLGASETDYVDVTDPDLVDVSRRNADLDLRFALNPVLDATADLGYTEIDPDGPDHFETTSFGVGLDLQRPAGSYSANVGYDQTEDGDEYSLSFGRAITLPRGSISATVGATRDPEGETAVTGSLSVLRNLQNGAVTLSVDRSRVTTDDGQRLVTSLSASYARPLTRVTTLSVDAAYVLSEDTGANTETESANIGATLGYQLTQDWSLNLGYDYRTRSETGEGTADENSISLGIGRSFSIAVR